MKVELKLYKTFDADLISLNANGISISAMIKEALHHYCRGEIARFYIKECKPFNLTGLKRYIHVVANISDPKSIEFLKREIKPRERSAFIRSLLRECLVTQQLSVYLKNPETIQNEAKRCQTIDLTGYDNVYSLEFNKRKHDYASEILKPAGEKKTNKMIKKSNSEENSKRTDIMEKDHFDSERFGSVSDLAISENKKKTLSEMLKPREEIAIPKANLKPKEKIKEKFAATAVTTDTEEPWDDAEDTLSFSSVDTVDTIDVIDPLSQFQNFLDLSNFD